jgi:hypothetical protein
MNIFFTKQLSRRRRVPRERLQVVTDIAQVTKGVYQQKVCFSNEEHTQLYISVCNKMLVFSPLFYFDG